MPDPVTLEGARLLLRPWRAEDAAPLAALNADPAVMRHFPAPMTRAESDAWMARLQAHFAAHGFGFWAAERRGEPGCIGAVGLLHIPWEAATEDSTPPCRIAPPAIEIGWRLAAAAQRQGYAAEAARLALGFGFARLGLAEILAFTVPANAPSWRLMERLGMARVGHFRHPRLPPGHPLERHVLYRLTRAATGFPAAASG